MITLIKNSLTDKSFYKNKYKSVTRRDTILFLLFISLFYSLLVTPIKTYNGYKTFLSVQREIFKLPTALTVEFINGELTSNFSKPLVIETSNDSIIVIDPENKFNTYQKNKSYLVFKQKGLITAYNSSYSNQEYGAISDLKITSKDVMKFFSNITPSLLLFLLGLFYFISSFFIILSEIITTVLIFGGMYFVLSKFFKKNKLTFFQICKRLVFLSIYLVIGYIIFDILVPYYFVPILIFTIFYFVFITGKNN